MSEKPFVSFLIRFGIGPIMRKNPHDWNNPGNKNKILSAFDQVFDVNCRAEFLDVDGYFHIGYVIFIMVHYVLTQDSSQFPTRSSNGSGSKEHGLASRWGWEREVRTQTKMAE
ncbi:MAG: hypothetical protein U0798_16085 [Gemmataceae bacterium]